MLLNYLIQLKNLSTGLCCRWTQSERVEVPLRLDFGGIDLSALFPPAVWGIQGFPTCEDGSFTGVAAVNLRLDSVSHAGCFRRLQLLSGWGNDEQDRQQAFCGNAQRSPDESRP